MDMSEVAVHRNSSRPAQLNALAYAQGNDIHLGPGQEQHLPHEAWHVVQQRQGRVRPTMQLKAGVDVNDEATLEHEADVMGARALSAGRHGFLQARTASVSAPAQVVACKVVQGNFAVQVLLDEFDIEDPSTGADAAQTSHKELRIAKVHIADRPDGLFKPDEKSHTTAWAVYTDQLRNAVLGRPVSEAAIAIHHLYTDAQNLPGVARVAHLSGRPLTTYQTAKRTMDELVAIDLSSVSEAHRVEFVQRLAKGFLAYRNAIPLSQVDIGRATGHGEPAVLDVLRPINHLVDGWEDDPADKGGLRLKAGEAEKARKAMWALLDTGVIAAFHDLNTSPDTAPGTVDGGADGGAAQRIADVITQHLWTLENTYETAFRHVEMDGEPSIRDYLRSLGFRGLLQDLIYTKISRHYEAAGEKATEENKDRVLTAGAAEQGMFSVQITLSDTGLVSSLDIGGRAPTALGSAQGSHATAWVVYVDAVRNAVDQKPFGAALAGVLKLCEAAQNLPGMQRVKLLTEKQNPWFNQAAAELVKATTVAKGTITDLAAVSTLQRLVRAYLAFRNVVPLSEIKGGLADGNAEARNRAKIRYLESNFTAWTGIGAAPERDAAIYLEAFWELYDYKAVYKAALHLVEPEDAPGLDPKENGMLMLGDSLRQHLISMHAAYPKAFSELEADQRKSVYYVLDKMDIRNDYCGLIFARIHGEA
ncbi:DUF4157 domain-containing protein [Dyella jejuensis]|uniref:DUF4157 domain-containing protein n=2 Tax=Dyella jejuensis TaxID=1432009 RepID=A0ABW8JFP5_9GAMM